MQNLITILLQNNYTLADLELQTGIAHGKLYRAWKINEVLRDADKRELMRFADAQGLLE